MANNRRDNSLRYPSRTNKKRLVRRPQPNSATFTDLLTLGAVYIAFILLVTLGFQWALPS